MTPVFFGALFAIKHVAAQVVSPANIGAVKHVTARLLRNARAAIPVRARGESAAGWRPGARRCTTDGVFTWDTGKLLIR
jgi:hypothetical protein